jgi:hypothetical protein
MITVNAATTRGTRQRTRRDTIGDNQKCNSTAVTIGTTIGAAK